MIDAVAAFVNSILAIIDPFCGPAGLFRWLLNGTILGCGAEGWGDEVGSGVLVTISLALATLPLGLVLGFFIALAKQSSEPSLKLAANIYTTIQKRWKIKRLRKNRQKI